MSDNDSVKPSEGDNPEAVEKINENNPEWDGRMSCRPAQLKNKDALLRVNFFVLAWS